jgi:hypothetical protein
MLKGHGLMKRYGGFFPILEHAFPQQSWNRSLKTAPSKSQIYLYRLLQKLLPNTEMHMDYRSPQFQFAKTKRWMQLDVYIPSLSLAFEYQGAQHYGQHYLFGNKTKQEVQQRDEEKRNLCLANNITLIEIPYPLTLMFIISKTRCDRISNRIPTYLVYLVLFLIAFVLIT